jgi:hypothetical protein
MKRITISLDVPDDIDEGEFEEKVRGLASRLLHPHEWTAEEVKSVLGVVDEDIRYVDVRRRERERAKWLYSTLQKS